MVNPLTAKNKEKIGIKMDNSEHNTEQKWILYGNKNGNMEMEKTVYDQYFAEKI